MADVSLSKDPFEHDERIRFESVAMAIRMAPRFNEATGIQIYRTVEEIVNQAKAIEAYVLGKVQPTNLT